MITIKNDNERDKMRQAGKVLIKVFDELISVVKPGISTMKLDTLAEKIIRGEGAIPAFKGYHGFPATLCTSVNEEVVHGMPGPKVLQEGDIIGIDVGAIVHGLYADAARTFSVGNVTDDLKRLIDVTRHALIAGVNMVQIGNRVSDISHAVQTSINEDVYGIVKQYVGHGIGRALHEEPQIPNFGPPNQGPKLKAGMAVAIEPMINLGSADTEVLQDGWTVVTRDKKPSAHFENTILLTENGYEVLTQNV